MGAQELSKAVLFAVHAVLAAVVTAFLLHESIGVLIQLLADALMILEISLQRWMVAYELLVFRQRRIATELFGNFAVFVKKLIEAGNLAMIAVTRVLTGVVIRAVAVVTVAVVAVAHIIVVTIPNVAISIVIASGVVGVTLSSVVVAAIFVACTIVFAGVV